MIDKIASENYVRNALTFRVISGRIINRDGFSTDVVIKIDKEKGVAFALREDKDGSFYWDPIR